MTLARLLMRARRDHSVTQRAVSRSAPTDQVATMTPGIITESVDTAVAVTPNTRVAGGTTVRPIGWPTNSSTSANRCPASAGSSECPSALPRRLRKSKGTRNFAEAAHHNAYLTCARLLRSDNVASAHTTENAVDCHR